MCDLSALLYAVDEIVEDARNELQRVAREFQGDDNRTSYNIEIAARFDEGFQPFPFVDAVELAVRMSERVSHEIELPQALLVSSGVKPNLQCLREILFRTLLETLADVVHMTRKVAYLRKIVGDHLHRALVHGPRGNDRCGGDVPRYDPIAYELLETPVLLQDFDLVQPLEGLLDVSPPLGNDIGELTLDEIQVFLQDAKLDVELDKAPPDDGDRELIRHISSVRHLMGVCRAASRMHGVKWKRKQKK